MDDFFCLRRVENLLFQWSALHSTKKMRLVIWDMGLDGKYFFTKVIKEQKFYSLQKDIQTHADRITATAVLGQHICRREIAQIGFAKLLYMASLSSFFLFCCSTCFLCSCYRSYRMSSKTRKSWWPFRFLCAWSITGSLSDYYRNLAITGRDFSGFGLPKRFILWNSIFSQGRWLYRCSSRNCVVNDFFIVLWCDSLWSFFDIFTSRELKHQAILRWRRRPEVTFCSGGRSGVVCQVVFVSRERENLHFGVVSRAWVSFPH